MKRLKEPPETDCASVWFARLERAKNLNDFERAAEAVRELRRLGVVVQFAADADTPKSEGSHNA